MALELRPRALSLCLALLLLGCGGGAGPGGRGDLPDLPESPGDGGSGDAPVSGDAIGSWPPVAPEPPVGPAIAGLDFLLGWEDPRRLPEPVSTAGWEDSAFISADGRTLYFAYTPLDFLALTRGKIVSSGPDRPGHAGVGFDIYEATFSGDAWKVERSSVNSDDPGLHEAAVGLSRAEDQMILVRFDGPGDLYLARREGEAWGPPEKLPSPIASPCADDNPHLSPDGRILYFDSTRADPLGSACVPEGAAGSAVRTIYRSYLDPDTGLWGRPEPLPGGPNATDTRWQVFLTEDAGWAYWSGRGPDCQALGCIYRARLQPDASYGPPEVVVRPTGAALAGPEDAVGIGEISITADGRFFYFVYVVQDRPDHMELSLGVARRRP